MQKNRRSWPLHSKILAGLALGFCWAFTSAWLGFHSFTLAWIDPFGIIFIRLLKMIALPLILFSIIASIASLPDLKRLGSIGLKTFGLYLFTTILAVAIGLTVVNLVKPGERLPEPQRLANRLQYEQWVLQSPGIIKKDSLNFLANPNYQTFLPSSAGKVSTPNVVDQKLEDLNARNQQGPLQFLVDFVPENVFAALGSNQVMLQVIFFAIFFSVSLGLLPTSKRQPLLAVMQSANDTMLKMADLIMLAAPWMVFALVAGTMSKMAETPMALLHLFAGLSWYALSVVAGLACMLLVGYPLLLRWFGGVRHMGRFFKAISPAQLLAFSTCSTAATLPVTYECIDKLGIPRQVSSFVLPIGATINMDGTSLYQAVAVVFLAQMHMVDLDLAQQLTIVLTATLASIGAASVPGSGLVMLIMVLQSVGLNPAWVAIILPVDRLLDMCRTILNVTGDCVVATIVAGKREPMEIVKKMA